MIQRSITAIAAFILALACHASPAQSPFYAHSYAVVVGVDRYASNDWATLGYAVKDAQEVGRLLTTKGFEVIELYNEQATKNRILTVLQNELAPKLTADDRVAFFFAGHGHTETRGGREWGYIVPYDGRVSAEFLAMEDLQRQSEVMGEAKHQLFVMDSCYGGLLGLRGVQIAPDRPGYLQEVTRRKARHVLTAGGAGQQVADGGPNGHSVFTGYLLKAIDEGAADLNGDGWVTFSEIQSYVTPAATTSIQTPAVSYFPRHEQGEMVFRTAVASGADSRLGWAQPTSVTRSLRTEGGVASFKSSELQDSATLTLKFTTLVCEASNDPRGVDEIFVNVEGRLPGNQAYLKRWGPWDEVCANPDAIPLPLDLWSGQLQVGERAVLTVRVREEDRLSGPEDVLAFQFDAWVTNDGDLQVQVVGLPVLEDTQRAGEEMAITLVSEAEGPAGAHSAVLSADYVRNSLLIDKRVSYRAALSW